MNSWEAWQELNDPAKFVMSGFDAFGKPKQEHVSVPKRALMPRPYFWLGEEAEAA